MIDWKRTGQSPQSSHSTICVERSLLYTRSQVSKLVSTSHESKVYSPGACAVNA